MHIEDEGRFVSIDDSNTNVFSKSVLSKLLKLQDSELLSREDPEEFEADFNCKSLFSVEVEDGESGKTVKECRNGPRNNPQGGLEVLERDSNSDACNILVNDNVADPSEERKIEDIAKCGFNVGSKAYCNVQISDDYTRKVVSDYLNKILSGNNECHLQAFSCKFLFDKVKSKEFLRFFRAQVILSGGRHYASVADNDKCVADAVTALFWLGTFGDNSMSLTSLVPVALVAFFFTFLM